MSASLELSDPLARRLTELMAAGVAVPEGLEAAASEADSRRMRAALRRLADEMRRGATGAIASPDSMERLTATLIAGSRNSGDFATTLAMLEEVETGSIRLRRRLNAAWIYPAAILALSAACGLGIMSITGNAYADMFREFGWERSSEVALHVIFYRILLGAILAAIAVAVGLVIYSRFFRANWTDRLYWYIPLVGSADRWLDLTIVCAAISQLLARDVPYPEALRLARGSTASAALRRWLAQAAEDLEVGRPIQSAVARLGGHAEILPALVEPQGVAAVDPAGAWEIARQYFLRRATDRIRLVRAVVPVIGYLLIVAVVFSVLQVALAPLGELVQMISGLS